MYKVSPKAGGGKSTAGARQGYGGVYATPKMRGKKRGKAPSGPNAAHPAWR